MRVPSGGELRVGQLTRQSSCHSRTSLLRWGSGTGTRRQLQVRTPERGGEAARRRGPPGGQSKASRALGVPRRRRHSTPAPAAAATPCSRPWPLTQRRGPVEVHAKEIEQRLGVGDQLEAACMSMGGKGRRGVGRSRQ